MTRNLKREQKKTRYIYLLKAALRAIEDNRGHPAREVNVIEAYRLIQGIDPDVPPSGDVTTKECLRQLARWGYLRRQEIVASRYDYPETHYGLTQYTLSGAQHGVQTPDSFRI